MVLKRLYSVATNVLGIMLVLSSCPTAPTARGEAARAPAAAALQLLWSTPFYRAAVGPTVGRADVLAELERGVSREYLGFLDGVWAPVRRCFFAAHGRWLRRRPTPVVRTAKFC
jgi:hypothetical protein